MTIEKHIMGSDTPIRGIMSLLDSLPVKLCVLVDDTGRLRRIVVDGDIRRALLAGASLDSPASVLPDQDAVSRLQDTPNAELLACFANNPGINAVVLTDAGQRPTGIMPRSQAKAGIPLSPPAIGEAESVCVREAFDDNWIAPAGPNLSAFEAALRPATGRDHTLALSSGTAAIHLALRVLGVGAGDKVYVSDLTFAASLQPILYQNADPVLIDSEPHSWTMSPAALKRRLEKDAVAGSLPKAVIVVHLYGQSADMAALLALADDYGIPVIEDAAESLGTTYQNRPSGSHGMLSAYSLNGNTMTTTSGGGALVSDRADLIDRARMLSTQGLDPAEHCQHSHVAHDYRLSNALSGIGMRQLEFLADRVARRQQIFETYRAGLADIPGLTFQGEPDNSHGNRWQTVISLDPDKIARHPYQLLRELRNVGIASRPAWKPMHMQPLCAGHAFEPHSQTDVVSARLFLQSLCLPSGSMLSDEQQQRIIVRVRNFTKG